MTITLMSVAENGAIYFSGLHQDIMICRAQRQDVEVIETKGMWIGLLDNIEGMINVEKLILEPGDTMLLYTDGLTEAIDPKENMFSETQLQQLLKNQTTQSPTAIKDNILKALAQYTCKDDITFVIIQRLTHT